MRSDELELIGRVARVTPARPRGVVALHRPLMLLWAFGQAVQQRPRMRHWSELHEAVGGLLRRYANVDDPKQATVYPLAALENNGLWQVSAQEPLIYTSGRRPTLESLDRLDPLAGLPEADYDLLATDHAVAAYAAALLIIKYLNPVPPGLLDAVGLAELLDGRIGSSLRPSVGERLESRTAIREAYGGQGVGGIGPLADRTLCVFSDDNKGPYTDGRIPDTDWIAYVGDGLNGDQELARGNKRLAEHQSDQRAVRFWHKPVGGEFAFETWTVVVERRLRWGTGDDGQPRREYLWILAPVTSPVRDTWPEDVRDALAEDDGQTHDDTEGLAPEDLDPQTTTPQELYRKLAAAAKKNANQRRGRSKRTAVDRYARSRHAREAVIVRSRGKCENPKCLGHSDELTDAGDPILQVDHIRDIAKHGWDTPDVMIALCPNCHALKTLGRNREVLRDMLLKLAKRLHREWS